MLLRLLTGLPAVALQNALAAPVEATRRIAPCGHRHGADGS